MYMTSWLMSLLFFGGWLSPFEGIPVLGHLTTWVPGVFWLVVKTLCWVFLYIWMRASLPRYRYDQIVGIGWKVLVPCALAWIPVVSLVMVIGG